MNKKLIARILIIAVVLAAGLFFFFQNKNGEGVLADGEKNNSETVDTSLAWNPYANEYSYLHTLSDFVVSAANGEYILKMTVTLNFQNEDNYKKFKGLSSNKEDVESTEGQLSTMEYTINDKIGELVMDATEEQLLDKEKLKQYLLEGINKVIEMDPPLLKDLYIENYVIQ